MAEKKKSPSRKMTKRTETEKKETPDKPIKESTETVSQTDKPSTDAAPNTEQSEATASKRENYVRGESQKPVTKAYRNNWNRIFK